MAWLDVRSTQNGAGYRYVEFEGARILEQSEVLALQNMQVAKDLNAGDTLFREGAISNGTISINGNLATLGRASSAGMKVYCNGAWEPLPDTTLNLPVGGIGYIYLHWVLWRVTSDGTYNGQSGCLVDVSLTDAVTGEATANRGQLQLILSTDQSYSQEPLDPIRMLSKSTTALQVVQLNKSGNVQTASILLNANTAALANTQQAGFVQLSTSTSGGVAAATNDPRLSDQRVPLPNSVDTTKVSVLVPVAGQQTPINSQLYQNTPPGVSTNVSFYDTLRAKLTDFLDWTYSNILAILGVLTGYGNRLTALENKTAQPLDLSYHIGKPLDRSGLTHPPVSVSDTQNFEAYAATPGGSGAATGHYAFAVKDSQGNPMGGLTLGGDLLIANPQILPALADAGLTGISTLTGFMIWVGMALKGLSAGSSGGSSGGGGGTPITTLSGDVNGTPGSTTVVALEGMPVAKTRSDNSAIANGDVLTYSNGTLRPAPPVSGGGSIPNLQGDVTGAPTATAVSALQGKPLNLAALTSGQVLGFDGTHITGVAASGTPTLTNSSSPATQTNPQPFNWNILQLGNYKVAFGYGALRHGDIMPFPTQNWNRGFTVAIPSLSVIPRMNFTALQLIPPNAANNWQAQIQINGTAPSDPTNWWVYITVISISPSS